MLAIIGCIAASNCSRIPENDDPVLGIWVKTEVSNEETAKDESASISEEWIFNDVFLGRYHRYSDSDIVYYTDFRWEVIDEVYTMSYSEDSLSEIQVSLNDDALELDNGDVFATRK